MSFHPVSYTHLDVYKRQHADWALKFMSKYDKIDESNIDGIINEEIGLVFKEVLECAGVYKCTDEGRAAFQKFIDAVNA